MPRRPNPRDVAKENRAFLRRLRRHGNARRAATELGLSRTRFTKRRAADPGFAADWDAALALARADIEAGTAPTRQDPVPAVPVRLANGAMQLRRPGGRIKLTPNHEQRFLLALSATANVRLSAAAAGLSAATFYARKRSYPGFAREWGQALEQGYARVEMALLASFEPESFADDDWKDNAPPEMPAMTAAQAIQLYALHQKEVRLQAEPPHLKRRRGESRDAYSYRCGIMHQAGVERSRERFRVAELARQLRGEGSPQHRWVLLPDLEQVTGWSKADPGKIAVADKAMFGGWRLRDWKERRKRREEE